MTSPLDGVLVVELDAGYASYVGKILTDFGARVIKVEPPAGAAERQASPRYQAHDGTDHSIPFAYYNAGKESVTLDLGQPDDVLALEQLVRQADVVLDGLGAGRAEALGLTEERLAGLRPGLVYASVSPFGQTGPWRDHQTSDMIALTLGGVTGQSGYDSVNGRPSQAVSPTGGQSRHIVGVLAATAVIAALGNPPAEGVLSLDLALHDAVAVSTESYVSMWEFGRAEGFRHTAQHASAQFTPPAWQFRCADGAYVCALTLYLNNRRFQALIDLFDAHGFAHGLAQDRYATEKQRQAVMQEIVDAIAAFCRQHPAQHIFDEAQKRQLPWSKVRTPDEVAADTHLHARGFYQPLELFPGERVSWPGLPWQGLPSALLDPGRPGRTRAPLPGEDNDSVIGRP